MERLLATAGCTIDTVKMDIFRQEALVELRPKTMQLLLLMLERAGQVVSKEEMLNTIWDDVNVDEQVIFQSIKELRKNFSDHNPIKTIPRKGYVWVAEIEALDKEHASNSEVTDKKRSTDRKGLWLGTLATMIVLFIGVWAIWETPQKSSVTGSVIILPVKTSPSTADQKWLQFGAMDHLIHQLQSNDQVAVLSTDYVLDVMTRAAMPISRSQQNTEDFLDKLFQVSGASLVVDVTVTGSPGDYQLIYHFYESGKRDRGAIFDGNVLDGLDQIAKVIAQKTGQEVMVRQKDYHSSFSNQLMASGLSLMHVDPSGAKEIFEAAIIENANDITAYRLATQSAMMHGDATSAGLLIERAMQHPLLGKNPEEALRLYFFAAAISAQQLNFDEAARLLEQTNRLGEKQSDWLYLAYASELEGQLAQVNNDFKLAEQHYQQALQYHAILQCPLGRSNGLVYLSKLAKQMGDIEQAKKLALEASHLVTTRGLELVNTEAIDWQNHLLSL